MKVPLVLHTHTHTHLLATHRIIPTLLVLHTKPFRTHASPSLHIYTHCFPFHALSVYYAHVPVTHPCAFHPQSSSFSLVIHPPSLATHTPSDVTVAHLCVSHPATASLESHPHPFLVTYPSRLLLIPPTPDAPVSHTPNCLPWIHTASHGSHPEPAPLVSPTHPSACHTHPLTHVSHSATAPFGVT